MKKVLLILIALICIFTLFSCVLEHTESDEIKIIKQPTCSTEGEGYTVCSVCEMVMNKVKIPATGDHKPTEIPAVDATCTNTGLTKGEGCIDCGKILIEQQEIPILAHSYDDQYDESCNECGHIRNAECVHKEIEVIKGKNATCTEIGYTDAERCKKCGEILVEQESISTIDHSYSPTVIPPTCIEQGFTKYTCGCGDSYINTFVDKIPHSFGEWIEVIAPTDNSEGQDKQVCQMCGETRYRDTRLSGYDNIILVSNPVDENYYSGKTLLLIGDSITCGVGVTDKSTEVYGQLLGAELGMSVINKGVSGSGYCTGGKMNANSTLTVNNVKNADVITIMLGINDFNWSVKDGIGHQGVAGATYYQLGEFGSDDTSTFYGALKAWCEKIVEMKQMDGFEDKQFVVITPLISSWNVSLQGQPNSTHKNWDPSKTNIHGHTLREYCIAIMEVCTEYGITVFDANMYSGIYYNSFEDNNALEVGGDGVHVNAKGHALLAQSLKEFILEGYTYEQR